ncbi:MAG TPA: AraC family transcriptional regulator [Pyrinomonadaceae bacterium]|jgi:AraC family transcriptional regulator of arabinose operon
MDPRIRRVLELIDENPHKRLSLVKMAGVAGLSTSRLRHKFKSEVGVTPAAYLQSRRLLMAKELLATRHLSVKETRAAVGIKSDSYFTHCFKRAFGVQPSRLTPPGDPFPPPPAEAPPRLATNSKK